MKQLCLASLLFLVLSSGCRKNISNTSLVGSWELRSVYGGLMAGPQGGNYPPGNGTILKFSKTTYKSYRANNLVASGTYTESRGISPQTGRDMNTIQLNMGLTLYYECNADTLTVYLGAVAADGTVSKYIKL